MRANATLLFFLYLLGVFVWRHFSKASKIQRAIHRAYLGPALQWYTLLVVGCAAMTWRTLCEFFGSYYGLDSLEVMDRLEQAHADSIDYLPTNSTLHNFTVFEAHLAMPMALRHFSMLSILAGVPVLVVAAGHIFVKFAYPGMRIVMGRENEASMTPWWPAPRMNRLITLMLMPVLLSVMSMRGSCRIWALTTGQAHNHFHTSLDRVEKWEVALYRMDQEVGQLFQFASVYAFCRICSSFLNEALGEVTGGNNSSSELAAVAKEFRRLVRYAGFLAVWAFILVGSLRCLLEFFIEESYYYEFMEDSFSTLEQSVLKPANTVFSFLTIMCVANMFIVGRTRTIKDRLGNANLKFMGARVLLLIIAIQEQASQVLTSDPDGSSSPMRDKVAEKAKDHGLDISAFALTKLQADLLHLSLLNLECLFVVVFNAFAWRDLELEKTGIADYGYSNLCADEEAPSDSAGTAEEPAPSKGPLEKVVLSFRPREGAPLLLGTESSGQR
jgi:hypothetical protein